MRKYTQWKFQGDFDMPIQNCRFLETNLDGLYANAENLDDKQEQEAQSYDVVRKSW